MTKPVYYSGCGYPVINLGRKMIDEQVAQPAHVTIAWRSIKELLSDEHINKIIKDGLGKAFEKMQKEERVNDYKHSEEYNGDVCKYLRDIATMIESGDYRVDDFRFEPGHALSVIVGLRKRSGSSVPASKPGHLSAEEIDQLFQNGLISIEEHDAIKKEAAAAKLYVAVTPDYPDIPWPKPPAAPLFATGDKLWHPVYGKGKIIHLYSPKGSIEYLVQFKRPHIELSDLICTDWGHLENVKWFSQSEFNTFPDDVCITFIPKDDRAPDIEMGKTVWSCKFGEGEIVSRRPYGERDAELAVNFKKHRIGLGQWYDKEFDKIYNNVTWFNVHKVHKFYATDKAIVYKRSKI